MFVTMVVHHLFASSILLLISNTGFSAEISVFVQTGASVQLDIQTQQLPEINVFIWGSDKSTIVTYITVTKQVLPDSSYEKRVEFNTETFSLTLKNVQKTDSGLYTARSIQDNNQFFAEYRVSVIDAVEAPVLTVNSNQFSYTFCTVNFTCRSHELMINSRYQNNRCSSKEVTSHEINTLILNCSEESITCNHSNPVSWEEDRINITQLCEDNERQTKLSYGLSYMIVLVLGCVVVGVIVFAGLVLYCCCKNKTDAKLVGDTDYNDVEILTQKMTGDTWTTVTYCTVGQNQTPS
ncbi:natural killer cell receptor 2B4-like [Labeo rohita]|uniref:natural killer cell receptor 2B4-like n=1 Tax=Labeo rohita TaxID=84645 RepID=UPI0021E201D1|nr:natural killer cell receptor 2B4-like [Labeo rohita]